MACFKYFLVFFASLQAASGFKVAFLITDVQNCFLEGGSMAVKNGSDVIPIINDILENYRNNLSLVVLTQEWHCANHMSFASRHPGKRPYETVSLRYNNLGNWCPDINTCGKFGFNVNQKLWPNHCVKNTTSASLSSRLKIKDDDIVIRTGSHCDVGSYSAFSDNGGFFTTKLDEILVENNITLVMIAGFALENCVYYTAMDAKEKGYVTFVIEDACRGVDEFGTANALRDMYRKGISTVDYSDVEDILKRGFHSGGSDHRPNIFAILLQAIAVLSVGMMTYM